MTAMIKTLLLSTLYSALRSYLGGGVYDRISILVLMLKQDSALPGTEKMAKVLAFARQEAFTASEYLLRAVVELVLYRDTLAK